MHVSSCIWRHGEKASCKGGGIERGNYLVPRAMQGDPLSKPYLVPLTAPPIIPLLYPTHLGSLCVCMY
jgi:hypothetical protein